MCLSNVYNTHSVILLVVYHCVFHISLKELLKRIVYFDWQGLKEASDDVSGRKIDNTIPATPTLQNDQQEKQLEKIQEEKQSVEQELDIQIQENRRLSRLTLEQTGKIEELESNLSRLQSESVDKSSLLEQIQSDKETVSRALQQNKILKEQLVELEEGFVKMVIFHYYCMFWLLLLLKFFHSISYNLHIHVKTFFRIRSLFSQIAVQIWQQNWKLSNMVAKKWPRSLAVWKLS